MATKDVAEKKGQEVGAVYDYGEDAGGGFENQTSDDISIPFLGVLQALSPQVSEGTVEGAKAGHLFNTVTGELMEEVHFIPAMSEHVFVEWVPRDAGGGFVAIHDINSQVVAKAKEESTEFGKYSTPDGNDLIETYYVYGVMVDADGEAENLLVIPFTSTKIKKYKNWNTKMLSIKGKPPMFANQVKITTVLEKRTKGNSYNFEIEPAVGKTFVESLLPPGDPLFEAGKQCREMVKSGLAKAAYETQQKGEGNSDDDHF